jgi:hypothetical protein
MKFKKGNASTSKQPAKKSKSTMAMKNTCKQHASDDDSDDAGSNDQLQCPKSNKEKVNKLKRLMKKRLRLWSQRRSLKVMTRT